MKDSERIRVIIVDDHAMVHIGLSAMLQASDYFDLVGEADSAEEAFLLCEKLHPDIVLMDLLLPGMSGIEATRKLKQLYAKLQIIALTSYEDIEHVQDALDAGAIAYLLKNINASELERAICSAYEGRRTLSPEVARALIEKSQRAALPHEELTSREIEVLAYVARGMSNNQIAEHLIVSPFTIKAHVSNILMKLGVSTRAEAAAYAVQHKLTKLSPH